MTDNLSHSWRNVPLEDILIGSHLIEKLWYAGFETAGDIMDSDPQEMAMYVKGIGIKRAIQIRQKVFDAVRPPNLIAPPNWVEVDLSEASRPRIDTISLLLGFTLCVLIASVMALLMAIMP